MTDMTDVKAKEKAPALAVIGGRVYPDTTETIHTTIDGKAVDVEATCLAGHGRPYGLYTLRMSARYASPDDAERAEDVVAGVAPARVFVYRLPVKGRSWGLDEFVCVADALDMDEVPPDYAVDDADPGTAFYRASELELCFRNSDMMYECRDAMFM